MDYEERTDKENEKVINEEYKVWKKNSPFLYDLVVTHALEWPSLTCQWFPTVERSSDNLHKTQELLLGTHTNDDEPNYVQIVSVRLPNDTTEMEGDHSTHITITQRILHDGEVNRARYKSDDTNIIATKSRTGEVYIFDRSKYGASSKADEVFNPTLRLKGHDGEGYGLEWNPHKTKSSHLLSSGYDARICEWDVNGNNKQGKELEPLRVYTAHTTGVEDIAWHTRYDSIFASAGNDGRLMIWDTRSTASDKPVYNIRAHDAEVNCVAFCPGSEWVLATGSGDKTAALWDLRNLKTKLHTLQAHRSEILQLAWSPHHEAVLATASNDRRILVWDMSRIDEEHSSEYLEDGPPELLVRIAITSRYVIIILPCFSLCMAGILTRFQTLVGILQNHGC
ncbi:WD40-repeat-containing domain protein [Spinellus fusiger]|nr:WD40-repeat-containing domain protein [Spinellus fusiger]